MILPDATPDDLTSHPLRMEALRLQEAGDGFSVWHGHDTTSGQDLEFLLNLENRTGYLAREGGTVLAGRLLEDGPHASAHPRLAPERVEVKSGRKPRLFPHAQVRPRHAARSAAGNDG